MVILVFVCLYICLCLCLCVCLCFYLKVCLCVSLCVCLCLSLCVCFCVFVCLFLFNITFDNPRMPGFRRKPKKRLPLILCVIVLGGLSEVNRWLTSHRM